MWEGIHAAGRTAPPGAGGTLGSAVDGAENATAKGTARYQGIFSGLAISGVIFFFFFFFLVLGSKWRLVLGHYPSPRSSRPGVIPSGRPISVEERFFVDGPRTFSNRSAAGDEQLTIVSSAWQKRGQNRQADPVAIRWLHRIEDFFFVRGRCVLELRVLPERKKATLLPSGAGGEGSVLRVLARRAGGMDRGDENRGRTSGFGEGPGREVGKGAAGASGWVMNGPRGRDS